MPLHLLGKKSWNVYNADNIARVKADEAAAAAREAAAEQRMQELDSERRAAVLRGDTPPPLPQASDTKDVDRTRDRDHRDRARDGKRRKLRGEDDTDMDIRLARSITRAGRAANANPYILKLRNAANDAPLTNSAGNIDLFPVDAKEILKREKNADAEKEKRLKERALEDQYTMRFSNAAGRGTGLGQPWYTSDRNKATSHDQSKSNTALGNVPNKHVWGDEHLGPKDQGSARIVSNDPLALMQKAQVQLKKSREDKKRLTKEREHDLWELRSAQEREERRTRHLKRKRHGDLDRRTSTSEGIKHHHDRDATYYRVPRKRGTQNHDGG